MIHRWKDIDDRTRPYHSTNICNSLKKSKKFDLRTQQNTRAYMFMRINIKIL